MPRAPVLMLLVFALTLFCSATLLFMVEPMIGKMILPLLGGTPAVWNTCMVFFQAVLLLGYLYAHLSTSWLGARKQAALHLVLLLVPFVFLPVAVNRQLIKGDENPVVLVLLILSLTVGVPMFVVSASAPLLQKWFASTSHPAAKDPYFLYGASNLGSMLSLIAYPTLVEPLLRLRQQSIHWTVGYGVLVALIVVCAVLLWLSPRNVEVDEKEDIAPPEKPRPSGRSSQAIQPSRQGIRTGGKPLEIGKPSDQTESHTLTGEVTWLRVLRWVALAFVPSSLMLGATTYITTDIAAMAFLWLPPLALYLLSFIIVFSRVPAVVHKIMVLAMPLLVLTLLFFMLSEVKPKNHAIAYSIALHLATLFVVSMVCHGELARDRPAPKYLTGYFLWMSVGGVLGGLFNGLLAPVIFSGLAEYELAMMLACFLAPPLAASKESLWGRRVDVGLAGLFVGIGLLLILLRTRDHDLSADALLGGAWKWELAALVLGLTVAGAAIWRGRESGGDKQFDRWMDLVLPLCLAVLLIGLSWGLWSNALWPRLNKLSVTFHMNAAHVRRILTYGVPVVMCYTFVERSLRFALGLGAVMLASGFCGLFDDNIIHQERSFFGVLKVENEPARQGDQIYLFRRLIHGTTLHGMQFLDDERRGEPLTYYHSTGPVGEMMAMYNEGGRRNLAVVGLGTGSMACYAQPGQKVTFYDIDPVVRRLSFDGDKTYFSFVEDARERGAHIDLVMGDARLTMERKQLDDADKYGVLIIDAFSSDAIPVHLITLEAMDVYLDKLSEDGLLAFHISNRYIDLKPVLYNLAQARGLSAVYQNDSREESFIGKSSSTWVVLARKSEYLDGLRWWNGYEDQRKLVRSELFPLMLWPDPGAGVSPQATLVYNLLDQEVAKRPSKWRELEPDKDWPDLRKVGGWTDDYSNLLSVFTW